MRMLLATVCLLLLLSHASAQECDAIQISDIGSNDTASTDGAIAQLFSVSQQNIPEVLVMSSRTVCLAAAATRDKYRFASVIVTYDCGGAASASCPAGPYPRTDQFEFECEDSGGGPVWQDSTLLIHERNVPVNPSITTLRRDCSFCISPADAATSLPTDHPVDDETHCAACSTGCLGSDVSLGLCTGTTSVLCCNYYESDTCTDECSGDLEPDANFDCVEVCDALADPLNGTVNVPALRSNGSVATYSCEIGFDLIGDSSRTCQGTGALEWSGSEPICQIVDCSGLADPANGAVSLTTTTFGSTATYTCNGANYLLVGDAMRTCQATGMWSGDAPTCEEVCEMLSDPANGQVTFSNERFVGSVATYICELGYNRNGTETRVCQSGSGWSETEPSCEIVDCGSLSNPANGMVAMTASTFGSTANYSCIGGYELVGNIQRTCEADGQWSGSEPTCNCPIVCQNGGVIDSLCTECNCTAGYEGSVCETDIDECTVSDPCQNGATCVNNDGSFTCNCAAGFEGNLCETDIDECTVSDPCQNGATCVNNDGSFTCNCTAGFEGNLCEIDIDECTVSDPCQNGATCVNNDGSFTCNCTAGFEGNLCETDIDECTVSDPCQNGATCVNNDGSFTCNCAAGFEGNLCEIDIDECTVNDPCQNGATCVNNDGSFTCNCAAGFEGNLCEIDIDECTVSDPCQNGATCVNNDGSFMCNCTAGFEGTFCEIDIDECTVSDPCQNGATCVNNDGSFTCNCTVGFEGTFCEIDIDECTVSDPCQNGATCVNNDGSFTCNCTAGFEGTFCEIDIDECTVSDPCQNGATCVNNHGSFTCNCTVGFEGNLCEIDIDECTVSDPCQNGATCVNNDGSFTCNCTVGYEGELCSTDIDECTTNNPCVNGTCNNTDGGFQCACDAGFSGELCDENIDDCDPNPCQNGGSCMDGVNTFTCMCAQNWIGMTCGVCGIDNCVECEGIPGVCIDCEEGYTVDQDICVCGLENCKTCEEVPAKCTECNVDYVLDMNAMCEPVCNIEFCTSCSEPDMCQSCVDGFDLEKEECLEASGDDKGALLGIIIGSILGALLLIILIIIVIVAVYFYRKRYVSSKYSIAKGTGDQFGGNTMVNPVYIAPDTLEEVDHIEDDEEITVNKAALDFDLDDSF